ncbi:GDNF family receptor alpha-like [Nelusetta ayraudi]|uniref:GDNF family receptor alpha-like n=1 Tax=Nelusetta ayraudi TaxID=303726 RepID=UPI003F723742
MLAIHLEIAVILGIVIPHMLSVGAPSPSPDCLAAVDDCLSNLCKSQQAIYSAVCGDEDCQIKGGLNGCNLTVQTMLERRCVCNWEEEQCGSMQALATQCHRRTAALQKRSAATHWQTSTLIDYVHDGTGSCLDRLTVCVGDAVCNLYLVPVLQACTAGPCDEGRCRQAIGQFYGSMPRGVAEMLVMCECEASDQSCAQMRRALHGSACSGEAWTCQNSVVRCAQEASCREILKHFQTKCWSFEENELCSQTDFSQDGCLELMDPGLFLGDEPECKKAFLATLGTVLHHPCSCNGVHNDHVLTCSRIHDVLHNRSLFMMPWQSSSGPLKPPKMDESGQNLSWPHSKFPDYLLYAFASVLLVGVIVLMPLALVCKIWTMKRRNEKMFHPLQKSNCVVIL